MIHDKERKTLQHNDGASFSLFRAGLFDVVLTILLSIFLETFGVNDLNLAGKSHVEASQSFHPLYLSVEHPDVVVICRDEVPLSIRILLHQDVLCHK